MKTGDTVTDGRGRSLQIGQLLGRGTWGRSYSARDESNGAEWVLKIPYAADELEDPRLAAACRDILAEQARLMEGGRVPGLPKLEARLTLPDGSPALLLKRYADSLDRRYTTGVTFEELISYGAQITALLHGQGDHQPFHGNLQPANILIDERGEVVLADPATPTLRRVLVDLAKARNNDLEFHAPEVREAIGTPPMGPAADTYAIALMLYRGCAAPAGGGQQRFPDLPADGLDKARLVALKDRVLNRLKKEHSNPRFHTRLSDRIAALLNRALSRQTSPSPPYRFRRLPEFHQRLEEIRALVHPSVTHVGRLILDHRPGAEGFTTDTDAGFSCTVACSQGVETHDEIACGIAIFDAERETRMRDVACSYTVDRHPSGRFRFGFRIAGVSPGAYRARIAFTIRDSGDEPATTEGSFIVRPAAGYVPPRTELAPRPLVLDRGEDQASVTEAGQGTNPDVEEADTPRPTVADRPSHAGVANRSAARGRGTDAGFRATGYRPSAAGFHASQPGIRSTHSGFANAQMRESSADPHSANTRADIPTPIAPPGAHDVVELSRPSGAGIRHTGGGFGGSAAAAVAPEMVPSPRRRPDPVLSPVQIPDAAPPEPRLLGDWGPLPPPDMGGEDLSRPGLNDGPRTFSAPELPAFLAPDTPLGGALAKGLDLLRGDAYAVFLGGAAVVIAVLVMILFALR